jgi:hypothetical protein
LYLESCSVVFIKVIIQKYYFFVFWNDDLK